MKTEKKDRENEKPGTKNKSAVPPLKSEEQSERFNQFWQAYPRKVAKDEARKRFAKIDPSPELLETILAALKVQTETLWQGREKKYIPHAATWLNGKRWEDETAGSITKSKAPINSFRNTAEEEWLLNRNAEFKEEL